MSVVIEEQDLADILQDLANLSTILRNLQGLIGPANASPNAPSLNGKLNRIINDLENPTTGLVFAYGQRVNILLHLFNLQTDVTALGSPQQTGVPVTLPTIPPTGYGGAAAVDIADAVWNDAQTILPSTPGDALLQVARSLNTTGIFDFPMEAGIFTVSRIDWPNPGIYVTSVAYPTFDPTDILPADTLLSMLTRQNPTWALGTPWGPQSFIGLDQSGVTQVHWTTLIDEAGFQQYKRGLGIGTFLTEPQAWPGLANVTLGSPLALSPATDLSEVCNGVLIALSSTPPGKPTYQIGSVLATAHIGQIAFFDDNGDMEYPQNLSMPNQIYVPQTMVQAAGARVRCVPGVAGTITAWTINP